MIKGRRQSERQTPVHIVQTRLNDNQPSKHGVEGDTLGRGGYAWVTHGIVDVRMAGLYPFTIVPPFGCNTCPAI
jgi:hypothetical protein